MEDIDEKLKTYYEKTKAAIDKVEIMQDLTESQVKQAYELVQMAENYFSDANYFIEEEKYLTALAAFSYAHAWLDAGVRLGLLNGKGDDRLFTLP